MNGVDATTEHRRAQHAQLQRFLRALAGGLTACAALALALAVGVDSQVLAIAGAGAAMVAVLAVGALRLAAWGRDTLAVTVLSYGFLATAVVTSHYLPSLYPTVILGCVIVVALALPYLTGRALALLSAASLLATVVVAAQGVLRPARLDLSHSAEAMVVVFSVAAAMLMLLVLLRHFSERIHGTVHALQSALDARDDFLSIASHELRTPLTALQLQLQGIERRTLSTQAPSAPRFVTRVATARRQTSRLGRLVDGLLDVSRLRTGTFQLEPESFDLSETVRDIAERLSEEAQQAGCAIDVDAPEPAVGVWDRLRVEQVLVNLVSNAVKYAPGAPVTLRVTPDVDAVSVSVVDRGPGVAPADLERIFGPYERATPPGQYGGLGLGLYIVRNIVEAHGGKINVTSRPGEGTTFTVRLPMKHASPIARTGT